MLLSIPKNGFKLAFYACLCTGAIVLANWHTAPVIQAQQNAILTEKLAQMLPEGSYDNALDQSCHLVNASQLSANEPQRVFTATRQGHVTAYIIESVAPDGYSGRIKLLSSLTPQGDVLRVDILEEHETPGLGDKIERSKSGWLDSFANKTLDSKDDTRWAVKKDGGQFDSFTGATITPRAVVNQLKRVIELVKYQPEELTHSTACQ